jgi:hypothetical protein
MVNSNWDDRPEYKKTETNPYTPEQQTQFNKFKHVDNSTLRQVYYQIMHHLSGEGKYEKYSKHPKITLQLLNDVSQVETKSQFMTNTKMRKEILQTFWTNMLDLLRPDDNRIPKKYVTISPDIFVGYKLTQTFGIETNDITPEVENLIKTTLKTIERQHQSAEWKIGFSDHNKIGIRGSDRGQRTVKAGNWFINYGADSAESSAEYKRQFGYLIEDLTDVVYPIDIKLDVQEELGTDLPSLRAIIEDSPAKFERIVDKKKAIAKLRQLFALLEQKIKKKEYTNVKQMVDLINVELKVNDSISRPAQIRKNMNDFASTITQRAVGLRKRVFGWGGTRRRRQTTKFEARKRRRTAFKARRLKR